MFPTAISQGRDCQVKAWRSGHQRKCKTLSLEYAKFQESLQTIEAQHQQETLVVSGYADDFDADQSDATHGPPIIPNNNNTTTNTTALLSSTTSSNNNDTTSSRWSTLYLDEDSDYTVFQAMVAGAQQLELPLSYPQSPEDDDDDDVDDDAVPNLEIEEEETSLVTFITDRRPFMAMFYNNIELLQKGDLWLFPSDKDSTDALGSYAYELIERGNMTASSLESTATLGGTGIEAVQDAEYAYFLQLARFLCFDVVGLANEVSGGKGGLEDEKENESPNLRVSCLGRLFQLAETHFDGLAMPRERFLELYRKQLSSADKDNILSAKEEKSARIDQQRMRRMRKGYAMRDFMDAHHK